MSKKEKLLQKALMNPDNLRFSELCTLAKQYGLKERENSSGHAVYVWNGNPKFTIPFQSRNGKAVKYQIKQLISNLKDRRLI